jgi:DNA-binding LacI/PurR family transcriptional regulator
MAESAVEMLVRCLAKTGASENKAMLDFEIVIRKSTAPPRQK